MVKINKGIQYIEVLHPISRYSDYDQFDWQLFTLEIEPRLEMNRTFFVEQRTALKQAHIPTETKL